jgi:hypothetical protein
VSTEARRNVIALLIAAALLSLLAAFAIRPAVVLPVTNGALAASLESEINAINTRCPHEGEDFRCTSMLGDSSSHKTSVMRVHADWAGCWHVIPERTEQAAQGTRPAGISSCVHLWNYY